MAWLFGALVKEGFYGLLSTFGRPIYGTARVAKIRLARHHPGCPS